MDAVTTARALADIAGGVLGAVLRIAEREIATAHGQLGGAGADGPALHQWSPAGEAMLAVSEAVLAAPHAPAAPFGAEQPATIGDWAVHAHASSGMAILAYGSLGGSELGFSSDLDLVFVYDPARASGESDGRRPLEGTRYYARLAQRVVHLLDVPTRAGRLYAVDVRLRPDGSKGLLVLGLDAWEAYQRERAWIWELQALVRARAVAGDAMLARRFGEARRSILAIPRDAAGVGGEVLAMRERWRGERDRSDAARFDLKQGRGGLVDLEFLLQALVLQHADRHPLLLDSGHSGELIGTLASVGLIGAEDAAALGRAYASLLERSLRCTLDGRPRVVPRDEEIESSAAIVSASLRSLLPG
ncbi:MAG: hypothetical protein J0H15_04360 [Xanthomonadales bacterium]|nr:hypothetical protein [Xanthomonadales bacterium]